MSERTAEDELYRIIGANWNTAISAVDMRPLIEKIRALGGPKIGHRAIKEFTGTIRRDAMFGFYLQREGQDDRPGDLWIEGEVFSEELVGKRVKITVEAIR